MKKLLEQHGNKVIVVYEDNTVLNNISLIKKIYLLFNSFWSFKYYKLVCKIIAEEKIEIVHVHNLLFLISPSIIYAAIKMKVPVIQTLHNYRILCPRGDFFITGKICEECAAKYLPYKSVLKKCYHNSYGYSFMLFCILSLHKLMGTWNKISLFIYLTEFSKQKFIKYGFNEKKMVLKPNFLYDSNLPNIVKKNYIIFVGRLSPEKRVSLLLDVVKDRDDYTTYIVGAGANESELKKRYGKYYHIKFLGQKERQTTLKLISEAEFLVFPSIWYETFGLALIEAMMLNTPIIYANLGAASEILENNVTGLSFVPNDLNDLTEKIKWAKENTQKMAEFAENAKRKYQEKYSENINYEMLIKIYSDLIYKNN